MDYTEIENPLDTLTLSREINSSVNKLLEGQTISADELVSLIGGGGINPTDLLDGNLGSKLNIAQNYLQSSNFVTGSTGWRIDSDGNLEANTGTFRGTLETGAIYYTNQFVYTSFQSFDGWGTGGTGGTQTPALGGALLQTASTANNDSYIDDEISGGVNELDYTNKNPFFQAAVATSSITNQTIYFGAGDLHIGDGTEQGFGFKITDGTLYAITTYTNGVDSSSTTTAITGITLTNHNVYRAKMTSGTNVKFYVNDVLRATHTTNLADVADPMLMSFYIKTAENANKVLYLRYALFAQDA